MLAVPNLRSYPKSASEPWFPRYTPAMPEPKQPSTFVALYKVFRWVALLIVIFVIIAALRRPAPVAPETSREAVQVRSQDFDTKLQQLEEAHQRGETSEAHFTSEEVSAAFTKSLEQQSAPANTTPAAEAATPASSTASDNTPTPGTSGGAPVRTVQVAFQGNEVTGQFATELYGKAVYITLSGRLGSKDGYMTFHPTVFKVGDLSVPISWVDDALQKKLAEPENREKLRLPEFVSSLRVENGELVITQK
jgi:hypothetical protein